MQQGAERRPNPINGPPEGRPSRPLGLAFKTLCLAAGIALLLLLLWYTGRVLLLAFAGSLVAIFLQSLGVWLQRFTRLPYAWSLVVAVALLIAVLGLVAWLIGARVIEQLGQFSQALPDSMAQLRSQIEHNSWGKWIVSHLPAPRDLVSQGDFFSQVTDITSGAANAIVGIVVVIFVGLYGAAQPDWYRRGFLRLVPPAKRNRATQVVERVGEMLRWWLVGQVAAMVVVGVLTALGLWLLGAPVPLALGLLAFALEIVPNIGPIISAIPAILLAWTQGPTQALYVVLLYVVIQSLESYVMMPLIQARVIELPPAIQILAVLALGMLAGFLGVLLAAPLVITVIVLVRMLYVEDTLGDTSSG